MVLIRRSVSSCLSKIRNPLTKWTSYSDRHFFAKKFEYIIQAEAARRAGSKAQVPYSHESTSATGRRKFTWPVTSLRRRTGLSPVEEKYESEDWSSTLREKGRPKKLRTDMIRRMDAPPKRVNPSGWISEGITTPLKRLSTKIGSGGGQEKGPLTEQPSSSVWIDSPMNLTSMAEKDTHAQAEDAQTPLNAYVIPGIVLYGH